MKSSRFFVTAVLFVSTAVLMACDAFHRTNKPETPVSATDKAVADGNAKIEQFMALKQELEREHQIILQDMRDPQGRLIKASALAQDYEWRNLSKAQRMAVKEKLSRYLALASEVLELDARKGIYVDQVERVIGTRDAAYRFQKSVENFEKIVGENFDPKPNPNRPAYSKSYDV